MAMPIRQLAAELGIPPEHAADIPAPKRATYERLIEVADQLNRGERPEGVIVCGPRQCRGGKS